MLRFCKFLIMVSAAVAKACFFGVICNPPKNNLPRHKFTTFTEKRTASYQGKCKIIEKYASVSKNKWCKLLENFEYFRKLINKKWKKVEK